MHFKHVASEVKDAFERGEHVQIEVRAAGPSGEKFRMILNLSLRGDDDEIKGVVVEGKSVEHLYYQYLREHLENIPECVTITDKEGKILHANSAVISKTGMSEDKLGNISFASHTTHIRMSEKVEDVLRRALSEGHVDEVIVKVRSPKVGEESVVKIHAASHERRDDR